jgi:hypothetical protein
LEEYWWTADITLNRVSNGETVDCALAIDTCDPEVIARRTAAGALAKRTRLLSARQCDG